MRKFIVSLACALSMCCIGVDGVENVLPSLSQNSEVTCSTVEKGVSCGHCDHKERRGKRGKRGERGKKGERGKRGKRGNPGQNISPFVPAFGFASFVAGPGAIISDPLAAGVKVPLNQYGPLSSNVTVDPSTNIFTVQEAGTYEINYFIRVEYSPEWSVEDGIATVGIQINGVTPVGQTQLFPLISHEELMIDSETRQIVLDLAAGDTIEFVAVTVPSSTPVVIENAIGSGSDQGAYISFHKIS